MKKMCYVLAIMFFSVVTVLADDLSPVIGVPDAARGQGEGVVTAIQNGNYDQFVQSANEKRSGDDQKKFIESCKNLTDKYGQITGFRFLTNLQTPLVVNQIWRLDFVKFDKNGKEVPRQMLLQLIFGNRDGAFRLLAMRVI